MAVHVPLFSGAIAEAKNLMMSSQNILSAADGHPVVAPTQDVVLGCYWLTANRGDQPADTSKLRAYSSQNEVVLALEAKVVKLQEWIRVKIGDQLIVTTPGRVVFNQSLPVGKAPMEPTMEPLPFQNAHYDRKLLRVLVAELYRLYGSDVTAVVVNDIKRLGFRYATQAGITVSAMDIPHPDTKWQIIRSTEKEVTDVERMYRRGVMTDDERYRKVIELWQRAYEEVGNATETAFDKFSPIWMMMGSGARGNIQQIRQLAGMRGLMADPDHRPADHGQLHRGPDRARVLHLDSRHAQGSRRHRASHSRLRVPDAAPGRRRPGRDRPGRGLRNHQRDLDPGHHAGAGEERADLRENRRPRGG
jgi:DNA-directed RNA polymerase subunit beta'